MALVAMEQREKPIMEERFGQGMKKRDFDELIKYLDRILAETEAGTIGWIQESPTTVAWDSPKGGRIQLKVLERRVRLASGEATFKRHHVLQVRTVPDDSLQLQIDGRTDSVLETKLAGLFEEATQTVTRRGLKFLDRLLS